MKQDARKKKAAKKVPAALAGRARIVMAGHVDHGKSTVLGRLLADSGAVAPERIESVKRYCEQHSRPFEFAFLLDALSAERTQGVTIDAARVLLRLKNKEISFVDAPGHADFIRNLATGAGAADCACLVVDAGRGLEENTRAHAALLALLGVTSVILAVNKMDLVSYREKDFRKIEKEWLAAAETCRLKTLAAIPLSAAAGENILGASAAMPWFKGASLLDALAAVEPAATAVSGQLRFAVQDVYKFTKHGDGRRIVAGNVLSGELRPGDEVVFYPSGKRARVRSLESFPGPAPKKAAAGETAGIVLEEPVFVARGEIMTHAGAPQPELSSELEAEVFWLGDEPLIPEADVTLLIGTSRAAASVESIRDGASLFGDGKQTHTKQLTRGMTGVVRFRLRSPAAFDTVQAGLPTARFVVVQNFMIGGGGLIVRAVADAQSWVRRKVLLREEKWTHSLVSTEHRSSRFGQKPALILISGPAEADRKSFAKVLEAKLFSDGRNVYFLSFGNLLYGLDADLKREVQDQREHFRRLGEVANIFLHAGFILVVSAAEITAEELQTVKAVLDFEQVLLLWLGDSPARLDPALVLDDGDLPRALAKVQALLEQKGIVFRAHV